MDKMFCPFINGECRSDCMFRANKTATKAGTSCCTIAIKLSDINEDQHDQLTEIQQQLSN